MISLLLAGASALAVSASAAADPEWVEVITVTGRASDTRLELEAQAAPALAPDAAALAARLPGAALIDNGALSGQVQYRGLFGPRVAVAVDGQRFASGGPNLMDPPLHYAPAPLLERLEVTRGPAPVSAGPALSARVDAVLKSVPFSSSGEIEAVSDLTVIGRTRDTSWAAGGVAGVAGERQRVQVLLSREQGGDVKTPEATLAGTEHERLSYGVGYAARLGADTVLRLDWRKQETGPTGNPPFGLDIGFFDSAFTHAELETAAGGWRFTASLGHARIDHGMNNVQFRGQSGMSARETLASAETWSGRGQAALGLGEGEFRVGIDGEESRHQMTITNPFNDAFFVTPFNSVSLSRLGAFAEWEGRARAIDLYAGLRADSHEAEAGAPVVGPALPMGPRVLQAAFIEADRSWDDVTVDGLIRAGYDWGDGFTLRAAVSRKTRAPGYLERFGWLPIPASAGLADGNTYVGSLDLAAEVSTGVEAGADWTGRGAYLRTTVYAKWIDDYIQGVPAEPDTIGVVDTPLEMVSAANGDPTPLRFSNVDARLVGFDAAAGYDLAGPWRIDAVLNYVQGERRDIDDDLYRIAPPNLSVSLSRERAGLLAGVEAVAFAEQDRVSVTNSEQVTPGYVLINLFGAVGLSEAVRISGGVENLLDHAYSRHLAGYNRNPLLGVPVGDRLPGAGASVWLRLDARF